MWTIWAKEHDFKIRVHIAPKHQPQEIVFIIMFIHFRAPFFEL